MCGICGWQTSVEPACSAAVLTAFADRIAHRGPDDHGQYLDPARGVGLAHKRLSILDLSPAGHQPMVDERTGCVLIYNGELYNFRALRMELEGRGHVFRSSGDTEVLLRALLEWGENALPRLCGMFAFAWWDPRRGCLLLARDPLGMKPLYYAVNDRGFSFASELKAFLALPWFEPLLEERALAQFLEFGYVFDNKATALAGVSKLAPGHLLEVQHGRVRSLRRYYHPPAVDPGAYGETVEGRLQETLREVVEQHLIADVPVGLLLSGGLDSSLLAALAVQRGPLTTVTMAFAGSSLDERAPAAAVSAALGTRHHEVVVTTRELIDNLADDVYWFDDLFADWGLISTRLLYRRCRELGIKVVIVGEGADELLGGYPQFAWSRRATPRSLLRLYQGYASRRFGRCLAAFTRAMAGHLMASRGDLFHAVRLFETTRQLPNNYVMKVDKASMSVGVEARAPYLDRRIADLLLQVPRGALLVEGREKELLRRVAERSGLLPEETARRRKLGGSMAMSWMDDDPRFKRWVADVVLSGGLVDRVGLRRPMEAFFRQGSAGYPAPHPLSLLQPLAWKLLLLTLWSSHYLERGAPVPPPARPRPVA